MILSALGRKAHWPADYISYAVELHKRYDAGTITKEEAECRLAERFPGYDLPDERTWRRWAHEKYPDLPEWRRQFLSPQEVGCGLNSQPARYALQGIQGQFLQPVLPAEVTFSPLVLELMNWMVFCIMLGMWVAMARMVISSL